MFHFGQIKGFFWTNQRFFSDKYRDDIFHWVSQVPAYSINLFMRLCYSNQKVKKKNAIYMTEIKENETYMLALCFFLWKKKKSTQENIPWSSSTKQTCIILVSFTVHTKKRNIVEQDRTVFVWKLGELKLKICAVLMFSLLMCSLPFLPGS